MVRTTEKIIKIILPEWFPYLHKGCLHHYLLFSLTIVHVRFHFTLRRYMQFDNRSVVHSLLKHVQATPIKCAWKAVTVTEYLSTDGRVGAPPEPGTIPRDEVLNEEVSDHTLRVENVPPDLRPSKLVKFFSRYDLQSVQQWKGQTSDGKTAPSSIYLVHFNDASWARAALREVQATYILHYGERVVANRSNPMPLRLSQFPKQLL